MWLCGLKNKAFRRKWRGIKNVSQIIDFQSAIDLRGARN